MPNRTKSLKHSPLTHMYEFYIEQQRIQERLASSIELYGTRLITFNKPLPNRGADPGQATL